MKRYGPGNPNGRPGPYAAFDCWQASNVVQDVEASEPHPKSVVRGLLEGNRVGPMFDLLPNPGEPLPLRHAHQVGRDVAASAERGNARKAREDEDQGAAVAALIGRRILVMPEGADIVRNNTMTDG